MGFESVDKGQALLDQSRGQTPPDAPVVSDANTAAESATQAGATSQQNINSSLSQEQATTGTIVSGISEKTSTATSAAESAMASPTSVVESTLSGALGTAPKLASLVILPVLPVLPASPLPLGLKSPELSVPSTVPSPPSNPLSGLSESTPVTSTVKG